MQKQALLKMVLLCWLNSFTAHLFEINIALFKILSGILMRFKGKEDKLSKINELDFGKYLTLIEAIVFNAEVLTGRYKKLKSEIQKRKRNAVLLFVFFISIAIICPIILLISLFGAVPAWEYAVYVAWCLFGLCLLNIQIKGVKYQVRKFSEDLYQNNQAYNYGLTFIKDTITTYFNKSEVFERTTKELDDEDFKKLKFWLFEMEMDFIFYSELVYKFEALNEAPILLKEDIYIKQREFSKEFVLEFLEYLTKTHIPA